MLRDVALRPPRLLGVRAGQLVSLSRPAGGTFGGEQILPLQHPTRSCGVMVVDEAGHALVAWRPDTAYGTAIARHDGAAWADDGTFAPHPVVVGLLTWGADRAVLVLVDIETNSRRLLVHRHTASLGWRAPDELALPRIPGHVEQLALGADDAGRVLIAWFRERIRVDRPDGLLVRSGRDFQ